VRTIKLLLEYDGSAYHGWQIQKDARTIQGLLEERVSRLAGERTAVIGASRTDAGVHAFGQVAAFRTRSSLDCETIKRALNATMPRDVRVLSAEEVHAQFHPRNDAIRKRYVYVLAPRGTTSAFLFKYAWEVPHKLDLGSMESAALALGGEHDFSAFMAAGGNVKDPVRTIFLLRLAHTEQMTFMGTRLPGTFITVHVEANGFLRHMVRNIVGTLVEIGRGKIPPERMRPILLSRDRSEAGPTAPPHGLFLERIDYAGGSPPE